MKKQTKREVVYTKPKVITIDARNSIIEGNLIEIPFLYYNKDKEKPNLVRYEWSDNSGKEFIAEVEGSVKYGLPTPYDLDILLALLRIKAKQDEIRYGSNLIQIDQIKEDDLVIHFSLNDIAKELEKTSTGAILSRIKKSIFTLTHTTITSVGTAILYDPIKKEHITTEQGQITHLIDSCAWKTKKGGSTIEDKNTIRIGKFFYYSIANSYFKYFDFKLYLSLGRNSVAKRMFLLLCKWRNNKNTQVIKLETLYERIPLSPSQSTFRKNENIKNAANALKKIGFIKDFSIKDKKITFVYGTDKAIAFETNDLLQKYNLFTEIQARMLEHGFTIEEIMFEHINVMTANMEYTKALLRYIDDNQIRFKIDTPKNYIARGLHNFFEIDKKYYNTP